MPLMAVNNIRQSLSLPGQGPHSSPIHSHHSAYSQLFLAVSTRPTVNVTGQPNPRERPTRTTYRVVLSQANRTLKKVRGQVKRLSAQRLWEMGEGHLSMFCGES